MSKVYVTQEGMHDYTDAEKYGDLVMLTRLDFNGVRDSLINAQVVRELRVGLRDFEQDEDWLIVAGSPYVGCAAFMILGHMGIKRVRVLRWSNQNRVYVPTYIRMEAA